jgi:hypothetical protein
LRVGGERGGGQGERSEAGSEAGGKAGAGRFQDVHRSFLSVDIEQSAVKGFAEK